MQKTTVSVRWQTVIPREIRQGLDLEPHSKLEWRLKDGYAQVRPLPADPVKASVGILRGHGLTTETLLAERRERAREEYLIPEYITAFQLRIDSIGLRLRTPR